MSDLVDLIEARASAAQQVRDRYAPSGGGDYLVAVGWVEALTWVKAQIIGAGNEVVKTADADEYRRLRQLGIRFILLDRGELPDVGPDHEAVKVIACPICGVTHPVGTECPGCP